jgi:hypothetical protein
VLAVAGLFLVASLAAHLHRALVSHGYCPEHGVVVLGGDAAGCAAREGPAAVSPRARGEHREHDCAFLSYLAHSSLAAPTLGALATVTTPARRPPRGHAVALSAIALLELAPKSSPPRA